MLPLLWLLLLPLLVLVLARRVWPPCEGCCCCEAVVVEGGEGRLMPRAVAGHREQGRPRRPTEETSPMGRILIDGGLMGGCWRPGLRACVCACVAVA